MFPFFGKFTKIPTDTGKFSFLPSIFSPRKPIQTHRFSHDSLIFPQAHVGLNIFTTLIFFFLLNSLLLVSSKFKNQLKSFRNFCQPTRSQTSSETSSLLTPPMYPGLASFVLAALALA